VDVRVQEGSLWLTAGLGPVHVSSNLLLDRFIDSLDEENRSIVEYRFGQPDTVSTEDVRATRMQDDRFNGELVEACCHRCKKAH
jgi:hypothetical protein